MSTGISFPDLFVECFAMDTKIRWYAAPIYSYCTFISTSSTFSCALRKILDLRFYHMPLFLAKRLSPEPLNPFTVG